MILYIGDEILMSTGISCHFGDLLQVSKKSLWSLILYIFSWFLYMYIARGKGRQPPPPRGQRFDVKRNVLSLHSFVASFKKNLFKFWFLYILFSWFNTCILPRGRDRQPPDSPQGTKVWLQQKGLITLPIVANFKKSLWSLILYIFFMI